MSYHFCVQLPYVFSSKLKYFCTVDLINDDKWSLYSPMMFKEMVCNILKIPCPHCSNTADTILSSVFLSFVIPDLWVILPLFVGVVLTFHRQEIQLSSLPSDQLGSKINCCLDLLYYRLPGKLFGERPSISINILLLSTVSTLDCLFMNRITLFCFTRNAKEATRVKN